MFVVMRNAHGTVNHYTFDRNTPVHVAPTFSAANAWASSAPTFAEFPDSDVFEDDWVEFTYTVVDTEKVEWKFTDERW
jgi:hypothetical protein